MTTEKLYTMRGIPSTQPVEKKSCKTKKDLDLPLSPLYKMKRKSCQGINRCTVAELTDRLGQEKNGQQKIIVFKCGH